MLHNKLLKTSVKRSSSPLEPRSVRLFPRNGSPPPPPPPDFLTKTNPSESSFNPYIIKIPSMQTPEVEISKIKSNHTYQWRTCITHKNYGRDVCLLNLSNSYIKSVGNNLPPEYICNSPVWAFSWFARDAPLLTSSPSEHWHLNRPGFFSYKNGFVVLRLLVSTY